MELTRTARATSHAMLARTSIGTWLTSAWLFCSAGCTAVPPDGVFGCERDVNCPAGQFCSAGLCSRARQKSISEHTSGDASKAMRPPAPSNMDEPAQPDRSAAVEAAGSGGEKAVAGSSGRNMNGAGASGGSRLAQAGSSAPQASAGSSSDAGSSGPKAAAGSSATAGRPAQSMSDAGQAMMPMAGSDKPVDAPMMPLLPRGSGVGGWNEVPGWNPQGLVDDSGAASRKAIRTTVMGDARIAVTRAVMVRWADASQFTTLVAELRNNGSTLLCKVSSTIAWLDQNDERLSTQTGVLSGVIRAPTANGTPESSCVEARGNAYLFAENYSTQPSPFEAAASVELTFESSEAAGWVEPAYRLVPAAYSAPKIPFVNTGTVAAPVSGKNQIAAVLLDAQGAPVGAHLTEPSKGFFGPIAVEPGAEIGSYYPPRFTVAGTPAKLLLLIQVY